MEPTTLEMLARLGAAAGLGLLIGIDREALDKPAGVRTMLMVSVGAALFTIIGIRIATQTGLTNTDALSRVVQGIVGGIGFLGAGVIIRERGHVSGVTTAAGVWVSAGVGSACGLGEYLLGATAAALAIAAFVSAHVLEWHRDGASGGSDGGDDDDGRE